MIRLFVAIAIPQEIGESLAPLQTGLAGVRWSPRENLHVTLRFAGQVAETQANDLDAALGGIGPSPFALSLAGVGVFEDGGRPHTLWAGVETSAPVARLHSRCETAARRAGLKPDTRAWRPHVTLAYLRGAEPLRIAAWIQANNLFRSPPLIVGAFGLYSSWRSGEGSVYRLERSYPLS